MSDVLIRTPTHRCASCGYPTRNYKHHFCTDTGYNLEDLPGAMDNRDEWRGRVREIRAVSVT